jgi:two-component sensor histidine kinase
MHYYKKTNSYGMKMIASLAKKLKATINFKNNNGLLVSLIIKKYNEIEN